MGKRKSARLSGQERKHLVEYGEVHPVNDTFAAPKHAKANTGIAPKGSRETIKRWNTRDMQKPSVYVKAKRRSNVVKPDWNGGAADQAADASSEDEKPSYFDKMLKAINRKRKAVGDINGKSKKAAKSDSVRSPCNRVHGIDEDEDEDEEDADLPSEDENEDAADSSDEESGPSPLGSCPNYFKLHFDNALPESVAEVLLSNRETSSKGYVSCGLGKVEEAVYSCVTECDAPFLADMKDMKTVDNVSFTGDEVFASSHCSILIHPNAPGQNRDASFSFKISKELRGGLAQVYGDGCQKLGSEWHALFSQINSYRDVACGMRHSGNAEEIRRLYCLHALNHVLKTRHCVLKHNGKLKAAGQVSEVPEHMRDQSWTRPKVLILVPFRHSAMMIVDTMLKLLRDPAEKLQVGHRKRFFSEYGDDSDDEDDGKPQKAADFREMFEANIDDNFKIGLSVQRKVVRLYTDFYSSDIVIASPLGLRPIIGAAEDRRRDYDFLSSVEVAIVDQADVFMMQNWEHVQHIFQHLNLMPKKMHGADISRVRHWAINEWSSLYRQSLFFADSLSPELNCLVRMYCRNFAGRLKYTKAVTEGAERQVTANVRQKFERVKCASVVSAAEDRLKYFTDMILPSLVKKNKRHVAIFVSSYFDFVLLRQYFTRNDIDFVQLCEYTSNADISRNRTYFFHGNSPILLLTERYYFYKRHTLRGIHELVFYQLPRYGSFYAQLTNMLALDADPREERNVRSLYCETDTLRLASVLNTRHAMRVFKSPKYIYTLE